MSTRQEILAQKKPKRNTMGRRDILSVRGLTDQDKFQYRWVNDEGERLYNMLEDGYTFVDKVGLQAGDQNVEAARGTESVMKKGVGRGNVAYLMKIPRDLFDAYKLEEQRDRVDAIEASMKEVDKKEGRYGSVEIEQRGR